MFGVKINIFLEPWNLHASSPIIAGNYNSCHVLACNIHNTRNIKTVY